LQARGQHVRGISLPEWARVGHAILFKPFAGGGRWMTAFVCCWGASGDGACLAHATSDGGSFPSNVGSDGVSVVCLCIFPYFLCISQCLCNTQMFIGLICWLW
jgi:hypothetical protein